MAMRPCACTDAEQLRAPIRVCGTVRCSYSHEQTASFEFCSIECVGILYRRPLIHLYTQASQAGHGSSESVKRKVWYVQHQQRVIPYMIAFTHDPLTTQI